MPSLRQRVSTYFRQLSFINEPRDGTRLVSSLSPRSRDDGCFITRYLEGRLDPFPRGPEIKNGKDPSNMPEFELEEYSIGIDAVTAACTGPDEGLTGVKRAKLHLSAGSDIDFIDVAHDIESGVRHSISTSSIKKTNKFNRSDQNANKSHKRPSSRKNSIDHGKLDHHPASINPINKKDDALNKNTASSITDLISIGSNKTRSRPNSTEITYPIEIDPIAGVLNWKQEHEHAFGLSVSLYEKNPATNEQAGNPIADCYGMVSRGNVAAIALADGVNWGEGARLAARSAVQGSLEYINTAVFGIGPHGMAQSTREVFISLLRSFGEAHACILEVGGALTTLTVAVILPLGGIHTGRYVVCSCNVGDSLGYVYSKIHGVREFTEGSHDIMSMRDMRDALGALGPVDGKDPELGNLTLSLTIIDDGDIVFLTSDGISDNFDPVVGKFAEAFNSESQIVPEPKKQIEAPPTGLASKRQNKSSSAIYNTSLSSSSSSSKPQTNEILKSKSASKINMMKSGNPPSPSTSRHTRTKKTLAQSLSVHETESSPSSLPPTTSTGAAYPPSRPKYMRSHTVIEPRVIKSPIKKFPKSAAGLPLVTGMQRHALTLLRLEDLLCYGINGTLRPCTSAKKLCNLLVDFAKMITSAKRKILEQRELYYKISSRQDGTRREVELNRLQHKAARKKMVDSTTFSLLPGKLDHASVVAFTVGMAGKPGMSVVAPEKKLHSVGFNETDF